MVADFMVEARRLLVGGVSEESLTVVGSLLAKSSRTPGFIPDLNMKQMHGTDSSAVVLQTDPDGLTLVLGSFSPKQETPVHDHNSWGIACVVKGQDRYRHWHHDDEGHLKVLYEKVLGPGQFVVWLDPPHDIHSQQGIGDVALELVLFGKNAMRTPRNYYDPETGEITSALPL